MDGTIFSRRLIRLGQIRKFLVERDPIGWRATEAHEGHVTKEIWSTNWRRVEGLMALFNVWADDMLGRGWQELDSPVA
jgi:hypothetical protein